MTKEYFENRTGKRVTESEYEDIENVYLNLPVMNRDKFCENWSAVEFNPIVMELSDYISALIRKIADLKE